MPRVSPPGLLSRPPRFGLTVPSPLGPLHLLANGDALVSLRFAGESPAAEDEAPTAPPHPVLGLAASQLAEYFAGERRRFSVPLHLAGTPFQQAVWQALQTVPYGEQRSYQWLAAQVGRPRATRAVGSANGRNPLPILVPCHRVIRADGSLGGYSSGLAIKHWLLAHEARCRGVAGSG